jgi:glycosyltransferase involved in cell wall biosynthesis
MTSITALLHTENDALRLGRALETLYACDHIVIVDHGSRDGTLRVAREHGARVVKATPEASAEDYLLFASQSLSANPTTSNAEPVEAGSPSSASANPGWILCLDPRESLTEKLAASLFEWKSESSATQAPAAPAFSVFLREETPEGWVEVPAAQTRLVPRTWLSWNGIFPAHEPAALVLEGELLRFIFP